MKQFSILKKGKRLLLWAVYCIFAGYIFYVVFTSQAVGAKLFFGFFGSVVLLFALLFDYLKALYERMIYELTVNCDLAEAKKYKEKLIQKDIFNGFKHSLTIFDALLLLDEGLYEDCLNHLEKHQTFFRSSLDYLFIYEHTRMQCYYFSNQFDKLSEAFSSIKQLKDINKKKMRPLFSWHGIIGMNYLVHNRNQKGLQELEEVNTAYLNNRETAYLLYLKAQCLFGLKKSPEAYQLIREMKSIGHTLYITQLN